MATALTKTRNSRSISLKEAKNNKEQEGGEVFYDSREDEGQKVVSTTIKHSEVRDDMSSVSVNDDDVDDEGYFLTCRHCNTKVLDGDRAITCDICTSWFHVAPKCETVQNEIYDKVTNASKDRSSQLHWYCSGCNRGASNMLKMINRVTVKIEQSVQRVKDEVSENNRKINDRVTKEVNRMESEIADKDKRLKMVETAMANMQKGDLTGQENKKWERLEAKVATVESNMSKIETGQNEVRVTESNSDSERKMREMLEEESRKQNLIIHRAEESKSQDPKERRVEDIELITKLCGDALELTNFTIDNIVKAIRLGKTSENRTARPLLVVLDSATTKMRIFRSLNKLQFAEAPFKNLSIDHDLTQAQREEIREMTREAKQKEEDDKSGKFIYRVRGPPGNKVIKKIAKN